MALIDEYGFEDRTILIGGAACATGAALGAFFARAGARVVLIDRNEAAILDIARRHPNRMDALRLDVMRPDLCSRLGELWEDEPIAALIHLQMLRHRAGPGAHLASVEALSDALAPGLGQTGRIVMVYAAPNTASATAVAGFAAYDRLPVALQDRLGGQGIVVNALRLPPGGEKAVLRADFTRAIAFLSRPGGVRLGGAVLPLLPRSD